MEAFQHRNPNQAEFWDERFARDFTPWHQPQPAAELGAFLQRQNQPAATLIPGCGHAEEVLQFIRAGWPVTALDFSAQAIQAAQQRLSAKNLPTGAQLELLQADFFSYQPASAFELIFERAFFCALPVAARSAIVAKWHDLLLPGGLLAGYFYLQSEVPAAADKPRGPPFICAEPEFQQLMQTRFELLEQQPASVSLPVFAGHEYWQVWRKKT